jgi:hypothetical protein
MNDDISNLSKLYESILLSENIYAVQYKEPMSRYGEPEEDWPVHTKYFSVIDWAINFIKANDHIVEYQDPKSGIYKKLKVLPEISFKSELLAKIHRAGPNGVHL